MAHRKQGAADGAAAELVFFILRALVPQYGEKYVPNLD